MSVMTESAIMNANHKFMDNPLDMSASNDGFVNLSAQPESIMVDPRLAMPYSNNMSDKPSDQSFSMSPSIWDTQMDTPMPLFGQESEMEKPQDLKDNANVDVDTATIASPVSHGSATTRKSSRTSSHSSIPSMTSVASSNSSQRKKRTRRSTRKKPQQLPSPEEERSDNETGTKRSKYLERNRIAASKCRQKKKEWVHELEETKGALEAKHSTLHREYDTLLQQVSELKGYLMSHATCNDQNIDRWIEVEARRFVQRSTDNEIIKQRLSGSPSMSVVESHHPSPTSTSLNPFPSTASPNALQLSSVAVKTEEINFDHMPDDMFD